jgi:hypothetical protein
VLSAKCVAPFTIPGPGEEEKVKPVTELALLGLIPKSPLRTVDPVFVTVVAPKTEKLVAVPRLAAFAAYAWGGIKIYCVRIISSNIISFILFKSFI